MTSASLPESPGTVAGLLAASAAGDPGRPLVTWYDQADGARVELSVATTVNWVAKTAGLLRDVLDAEPGSRVSVDLPAHWQSTVWVLACWTLGAVLVPPGSPDLDVAVVGPNALGVDTPDAAEVVATALHPLGARFAQAPPVGITDFGAEVLAMPDVFTAYVAVTSDTPAYADAARAVTQAQLLELAGARATALGLHQGARLLSVTDPATLQGALTTVLAPLMVGGSLVLVTNPDPGRLDDLAAQEQVDVRAS